VLKTISPKTVAEKPKPSPSRKEPSSKTSFPNFFAWLDFFVVIVTLVES